MAVYIEYAIIDNFVIDFLLLFAVVKTLRLKCKVMAIVFSAMLGTVFAIFLPLLTLPAHAVLICKSCVAPLICLPICCGAKKKYFYSILLLFAYTFVLGGILLGLLYSLGDYSTSSGTIGYNASFPIGLTVLAVASFVYLVYTLFKYLQALGVRANGITSCTLTVLDKQFNLEGFADSGNTLEYGGLPVIFLTDNAVMKSIGKSISKQLSIGKSVGLTTVCYATLSGCGRAKALPTDISIDGQTWRVMLAMTRKSGIYTSLILNAKLFGGQNEVITDTKKPIQTNTFTSNR